MNDKAKIEGILLVSGSKGISVVEIKKMFDNKTADDIKEIIKEISKKYENDDECGFTIKVFGNTFYLLTKSNLKNDIEKVVTNYRKTPLTPAIMEILSIIAYNSPCTISTVENIRGTSADNIIKKLESWELIKNIGRSDTPGRPFLYTTAQKFFNIFGIKSLSSLPKIDEIESFDDSDFFESNRVENEEI